MCFVLQRRTQKNIKIVENNFYLTAHKWSGFDTYFVLNKLPQWRSVVCLIKNGAVIVSLKIFKGYVDEKRKIPQYVHFRCSLLHIKDSFKKIGKNYNLQESLLKKELEHNEMYEDTWEEKESEWLLCLENDVLSTVFSYARYTMSMAELTGISMKNSLTLPSLAKKNFQPFKRWKVWTYLYL